MWLQTCLITNQLLDYLKRGAMLDGLVISGTYVEDLVPVDVWFEFEEDYVDDWHLCDFRCIDVVAVELDVSMARQKIQLIRL